MFRTKGRRSVRDRRTAERIIETAIGFWEMAPDGQISEERAVEKINGLLMRAGAKMGLIHMAHWPMEGEDWEETMVLDEKSAEAFWVRYGPPIKALLEA
jgi:hypothetical protein